MKRFLKLLLLTPMAFSISGCQKDTPKTDPEPKPDPTPVNVVIVSGQSNGVGCARTSYIKTSMGYSKYQQYLEGFPGIKISYQCWDKDYTKPQPVFYKQNYSENDDFEQVMVGQGNYEGAFGPEIGIAETLNEKFDNKLFIIKCGCGSSNLKDDWVRNGTAMYRKFVEYVKDQMKKLEEMNYKPTIKAFCWMQGEGDAWDGYYQDYYQNTKTFVQNIRADLKDLAGGNEELPFIDAGISNSKLWQFYRKVNEAKQQFAEESENNIYIDTIGEGLHTNEEPFDEPDTAHYDSESQVQLGHLFAQNFVKFLAK